MLKLSFFLLPILVQILIQPAVSQDYGTNCTLLSNCTTCTTDQSRCLQCTNYQYLDLTTYQCVSSCSTGFKTFNVSTGYAYCRNYKYYIDPNSNVSIRLGTFEYPFVRLVYPFRELWNYYMDVTNHSATIYIKQNTTNILYNTVEPLLVIYANLITVRPYSADGSTPTIYPLIVSNLYTPVASSTFSPLSSSLSAYNFTGRVALGQITTALSTAVYLKFAIFQAGFSMKFINLAEYVPSADSTNLYFQLAQNAQNVTFENCVFVNYSGTFMKSTFFQTVIIRNSTIYITTPSNGPILQTLMSSETATCYTGQSYVLFENNIVYGNNPPTLAAFFRFNAFGPVTIQNNYFYNFVGTNAAQVFLSYSLGSICFTPLNLQYIFDRNVVNNTAITSSSYAFVLQYLLAQPTNAVSLVGVINQVIFTNNYFTQMVNGSPLLVLTSSSNTSVTIENNTFENITIFGTTYAVLSLATSTTSSTISYTFVGNSFKNIFSDQLVYIQGYNGVMTNNTFDQIVTNSTTLKSTGMLQITTHNNFVFTHNVIKNSIIYTNYFVSITSSSNVTFTNLDFDNVTIWGLDAAYFASNILYNIDSIVLNNVAFVPQSTAVLNFGIINSGTNITVANIDSTYQYGPIFKMGSVTANNTLATTMLITNITVDNMNSDQEAGLFQFGTFVYDPFSVTISNVTFSNVNIPSGYLFQSSMVAHLIIKDCSFTNITGSIILNNPGIEGTGIPWGYALLSNFDITGCSAGQYALIMSSSNGWITVTNVTFTNNYGLNKGSVALADSYFSQIEFINCNFFNNYAVYGGVFYTHDSSSINVTNAIIQDSFAMLGGIAYANDDGMINYENCSFINNRALNGNFLYIMNCDNPSTLSNAYLLGNNFNIYGNRSTFVDQILGDNYTDLNSLYSSDFILELHNNDDIVNYRDTTDTLIMGAHSAVSFYNIIKCVGEQTLIQLQSTSTVTFMDAVVDDLTLVQLIEASYTTLGFYNTTFSNLEVIDNSNFFILIYVDSYIIGSGLTLTNFQGQFVWCMQIHINIDDVHFNNISVQSLSSYIGGSFIYTEQVEAVIDNFTIEGVTSNYKNLIEIYSGTIELSNGQVDNVGQRFIYLDNSFGTFDSVEFNNGYYSPKEATFPMEGGLFLYSYLSSMYIDSCSFTGNNVPTFEGGLIYIHRQYYGMTEEPQVVINSDFNGNTAYDGGCISANDVNMNIENCNFNGNSATQQAGAITFYCSNSIIYHCQENIYSSSFIENHADFKGGAIVFDYWLPYTQDVTFEGNTAAYGNTWGSYPMYLAQLDTASDFNSGYGYNGTLLLGIMDMHGQVSGEADGYAGTIILNATDGITLSGASEFKSTMGTFNLSGLTLTGVPGSTHYPQFSIDGIDVTRYMIMTGHAVEQFNFNLTMRICVVGEIYKSSMCVPCAVGTYSFFTNDSQCSQCPDSATCPGLNHMEVYPDHWRSNLTSALVYSCLATGACMGGEDSACGVGYEGRLCHECSGYNETTGKYWGRTGDNDCMACGPAWIEITKLAAMFLFYCLYVVFLSVLIIRGPSRKKDDSVLMRILTNYFQVVSLLLSLDLSLPQTVSSFLSSYTIVSSSPSNFINVGCMIQFKRDSMFLTDFCIQVIIMGALPIIFGLMAFAIWKLVAIIKPLTFGATYARNAISTIMVFLFLMYPNISKGVMQLFICKDIDSKYYLESDMNVQCFTLEHAKLLCVVGLPILVVWVIGFPCTVLYLLKRKKTNLDKEDTIIMFGIFYIGLRDEWLHYEIILNNIKKLLCTAWLIALGNKNPNKVCMLYFISVFVFQQGVRKWGPYMTKKLNDAEITAFFCAGLTIVIATYFSSGASSENNLSQMILFSVLILVNFIFVTFWAYTIGKVYWVKYGHIVSRKIKKDTLKTSERDIIDDFKKNMNQELESSRINIQAEETKVLIEFSPDTPREAQTIGQGKTIDQSKDEGEDDEEEEGDEISAEEDDNAEESEDNDGMIDTKSQERQAEQSSDKLVEGQSDEDDDEEDDEFEDKLDDQRAERFGESEYINLSRRLRDKVYYGTIKQVKEETQHEKLVRERKKFCEQEELKEIKEFQQLKEHEELKDREQRKQRNIKKLEKCVDDCFDMEQNGSIHKKISKDSKDSKDSKNSKHSKRSKNSKNSKGSRDDKNSTMEVILDNTRDIDDSKNEHDQTFIQ